MSGPNESADFEALLDYLKRSRGFDFSAYKRSTLGRRVQKRMRTVGIGSYSDYVDYLEVHPEEFSPLFNTILINMTGFFRDRPAWDYLASEILPRIIAERPVNHVFRVWSAGCASGEEAYTVAMLLAEALGVEQFRERVKIYATDVDEDALNQARQAIYSARAVQDIPPDFLAAYFEPVNEQFVFAKDLRRSIIFGRNDLLHDAPISRIDLLICRNTLMYFNADAQTGILAHFHFALHDAGYLFLGKGEMLLTHGSLFTPADLRRRIFSKVVRDGPRERGLPFSHLSSGIEGPSGEIRSPLRSEAFDSGPIPQVIIDSSGRLSLANRQARTLFGLTTNDLGRPLQDLEISYRPTELRSQIERAIAEHRPVAHRNIEWHRGGVDRVIDVQVTPLFDVVGALLGTSVTFADNTQARYLERELQHSRQELETAYEELQSTIEELETTNEELQSTNEELETTNEELQSTNEELETMNEELQSTNDGLEMINSQVRERTRELDRANGYLNAILSSLRVGVVVLNERFEVQIWNRRATDLWGLRQEEVDHQNFLSLDIGLPVAQLRQPIRACLNDGTEAEELTLDAVNRRGRSIRCKVSCMPLNGGMPVASRSDGADGADDTEAQGVVLLMEEAQTAVRES